MMFGNGEFKGDFKKMKGHMGKGPEGKDREAAAASAECTAAVTGLQALLTPVAAPAPVVAPASGT